jgi:DNA mismatch repair protein MLH1
VGLDGGMRFQLRGYISNLTYVGRRTTLVLFINGRPVEHGQLKRGLEALYAAHNPKAGKPWVFFDLLLPPRHVEVNMHPTKKEVGFLHQDAVVDAICQEVEQVLLAASSTRSFTVARLPLSSQLPDNGQQAQQAALPAGAPGSRKPQQQDGADAEEDAAHAGVGQSSAAAAHSQLRRRSSSAGVGDTAGNSSGSQLVQLQLGGGRPSSGASQLPSARPERLVRMDPRMQTLDSFLVRQPAAAAAQGAAAAAPVRKRKASAAGLPAGGAMPFAEGEDAIDLTGFNSSNLHLSNQAAAAAAEAANGVDADQQQQEQQLGHSRPDGVSATPSTAATAAAAGAGTQAQGQGRLRLGPVATQLSSIRELLEEVEAERHEGLSEMLRDHVWVGMVGAWLGGAGSRR